MKSKFLHICVIALAGHTFVNASELTQLQDKTSTLEGTVEGLNVAAISQGAEDVQATQGKLTEAINQLAESETVELDYKILQRSQNDLTQLLTLLKAGQLSDQQNLSKDIDDLLEAQAATDALIRQMKQEENPAGVVPQLAAALINVQNKLDQISDSFENAKTSISGLEETVKTAEKDITKLKAEKATKTNYDKVNNIVTNMASTIDNLTKQIEQKADRKSVFTLDQSLKNKAAATDLSALSIKVDSALLEKADQTALSALQTRMNNQIARLSSRIAAMSSSSEVVSSNGTSVNLDNIKKEINESKIKIAQEGADIFDLKNRMGAIDSKMASAADLAALEKQINLQLANKAGASEVAELGTRVDILQKEQTRAQSGVNELSDRMSDVRSKITSLESSKASMENLSALHEDFGNTKSILASLQEQVQGNEENIKSIEGLYQMLTTSLTEAEATLSSLSTLFNTHVDNHIDEQRATAEEQVAALEAQLADLQDLKRLADELVQVTNSIRGGIFANSTPKYVLDALDQYVNDVSAFIDAAEMLESGKIASGSESSYINGAKFSALKDSFTITRSGEPVDSVAIEADKGLADYSTPYATAMDALNALATIASKVEVEDGTVKVNGTDSTAAAVVAALQAAGQALAENLRTEEVIAENHIVNTSNDFYTNIVSAVSENSAAVAALTANLADEGIVAATVPGANSSWEEVVVASSDLGTALGVLKAVSALEPFNQGLYNGAAAKVIKLYNAQAGVKTISETGVDAAIAATQTTATANANARAAAAAIEAFNSAFDPENGAYKTSGVTGEAFYTNVATALSDGELSADLGTNLANVTGTTAPDASSSWAELINSIAVEEGVTTAAEAMKAAVEALAGVNADTSLTDADEKAMLIKGAAAKIIKLYNDAVSNDVSDNGVSDALTAVSSAAQSAVAARNEAARVVAAKATFNTALADDASVSSGTSFYENLAALSASSVSDLSALQANLSALQANLETVTFAENLGGLTIAAADQDDLAAWNTATNDVSSLSLSNALLVMGYLVDNLQLTDGGSGTIAAFNAESPNDTRNATAAAMLRRLAVQVVSAYNNDPSRDAADQVEPLD